MTARACEYCNATLDSVIDYQYHLRHDHDPSELGRIDRRLARSADSSLEVARRRILTQLSSTFGSVRAPLPVAEMAKIAGYGVLASILVATVLGVSP